jgi:8-oxo-dGTP diphosphatase
MASPMLPANAPVLASLALPHEYAVTDAENLGRDILLSRLAVRLKAGLKLIQVRDRNIADRDAFARAVLELARPFQAQVLINGGPGEKDGIHAMGDGIHFTARQMMALKARPEGGLAAASVHTREELERAMRLELDFAVLGPVKETATHAGAATLGWDGFSAIARGCSIPVYAIGGLKTSDLPVAWSAGAHGLAMISGAWGRAGR